MANKPIDTENNTQTELDILKSIEQAYFKNNASSQKRNTQKSLKWFSTYVPRAHNSVRTARMFRDKTLWQDRVIPGNMYFYQYDAKHKDTLPVWDMYPLVFFFDSYTSKEGKQILLGINMHYLKPSYRYAAMMNLLRLRNEKRYRANTKLQISWEVLKGMANSKYFEHAVKAYRVDHIRSKFIKIPATAWELTLFLPLARWQKGSKNKAWNIKK